MKTIKLYLFFLVLLQLSSANAYMYKHTDDKGVTTYTDTEVEGAEQINPPTGNTIKLPKYVTTKKPVDDKKADYTDFRIISPENDSTYRDNNGDIPIALSIEPELNTTDNHSISVYLDGKVTSANNSSLAITVNNVDRGSHTIHAVVNDANAKTLIESNSITVHLKKFSILH